MEFTREPVIETVITPKEGCKLVVRSSKNTGQEEYFVDAIEVVSFGHTFFFRSLEKPKSFLVPTSDYEILEVRETRMVLKNVGLDRSIKIGGGRDGGMRTGRSEPERHEAAPVSEKAAPEPAAAEAKPERADRKRDRRRGTRRRRGSGTGEAGAEGAEAPSSDHPQLVQPTEEGSETLHAAASSGANLTSMLGALLPPPPTLISETIKRYKDNELFRGAFFREDEENEGGSGDAIAEVEAEINAEMETEVSAQEIAPIEEEAPVPPLPVEEPVFSYETPAEKEETHPATEEEAPGQG